jgi:competence protein ComFC
MHVVLVDDVFTTGATMQECAAVLKKAGASHVTTLTLARAI